jgi:hypothetical protein
LGGELERQEQQRDEGEAATIHGEKIALESDRFPLLRPLEP